MFQLLDKGGATFLQDLRAKSYEEARKELLTFTGIGPKVAGLKRSTLSEQCLKGENHILGINHAGGSAMPNKSAPIGT